MIFQSNAFVEHIYEEKFRDKNRVDEHKREHQQNEDDQTIQISSMTLINAQTKYPCCEDDTCNSGLNKWLPKAKEIPMWFSYNLTVLHLI